MGWPMAGNVGAAVARLVIEPVTARRGGNDLPASLGGGSSTASSESRALHPPPSTSAAAPVLPHAANMSGDASPARYYNYPPPKEGPGVPNSYQEPSNPVLRTWPLAIASAIIASSTFIQGLLWKSNKFDQLKEIQQLKDYEPRHDPTVVPVPGSRDANRGTFSLTDLPPPRPRRDGSAFYTCADYHELYKQGKLTPTSVIRALLPLIRRDTTPPGKHAVAFLDSKVDLILKAAEASTKRYKLQQPLSVLDGVPIAVKDEADLAGYRRTLGTQKLDFTNPEDRTAWCVEKWQDAGAIAIGKTNMHELGLDTTNNNPNTGTPLNPFNPGYYTGGSSGGSAYAVASGLCPIALGVDGGGSIRLPASVCGIYGLKPSHNRVSGRPTHDLGCSVGVYGPMASSIDDLALAYSIMAQPDPEHPQSALFPPPHLQHRVLPVTKYLGVCEEWIARSDHEVREMYERAMEYFVEKCGYEKVSINLPFLPEGQKAHAMTILSEIRSGVTPEQISTLTYASQLLLNIAGGHATCQDFLYAQRLRDAQMRHMAWLWRQYPGMIVVTPTTPCVGWKIGSPGDIVRGGYGMSDGDMTLRSMEYVYLANWTGCPALSCPMSYDRDTGVPVGIMGMGEWGSETQLLAWAKEGEGILGTGGVLRPPSNWVDVLSHPEQS